MPATMRLALAGDAPALAALHLRGWQVSYRGILPDALLDGLRLEPRVAFWEQQLLRPRAGHRTWGAVRDGVLLGFADAGPADPADLSGAGEITAIYVDPDHLGTGLGRELMAAAVDYLHSGPWTQAILWTLRDHPATRRFYTAAGWHEDGEARDHDMHGHLVPLVRYRLALGDPGALTVRPAAGSDAAAIADLNVRAWQVEFPGLVPEELLRSLDPADRVGYWEDHLAAPRAGYHTVVVLRRGRVIGFAHLGPNRDRDLGPERTAELWGIYVDPASFGTGAGRALMAAVLDHLRAGPRDQATLWTLCGNSRADRFYEASGWQRDGGAKDEETPHGLLHEVRYRIDLR